MPVGMRSDSRASISDRFCNLAAGASDSKRLFGVAFSATVSTSVFQALQPGHWPCHFGLVAPHSVQL